MQPVFIFKKLHVLAVVLCLGLVAGFAKEHQPNIIMIFIDDMGYGDIGPFGNNVNKTPQLDRMAAEGLVMTDFYVSSTMCTPSRSALMTGCYADRIGMDGQVLFPADVRGLHPDEITIAEILREAGYRTGCFGKWHLGDQPGFLPLQQGFDVYAGTPYSNDMWPRPSKDYPPLPYLRGNEVVAWVPDGTSQALLCDAVTMETIDFIKRSKDQPFFAYVPHSYVHLPRYSRKQNVDAADGDITRAQIEEVDASVGRILDAVRELGIEKRTLVFFTSDNGGASGTSKGPLRGGKGGPKYEGHMRVPTIVWWPGTIPAGTVSGEIGATIDLMPTFANLAGASIPDDRVIDGVDITSLILGQPGAKSPHEVLYYEYEGVRKGNWKLVVAPKQKELFNLGKDPGEKRNLAQRNPEKLAELSDLIDAHKTRLQEGRRPAAFVENPMPLLKDTGGLPSLAELLGQSGIEAVGENVP